MGNLRGHRKLDKSSMCFKKPTSDVNPLNASTEENIDTEMTIKNDVDDK